MYFVSAVVLCKKSENKFQTRNYGQKDAKYFSKVMGNDVCIVLKTWHLEKKYYDDTF
jgi:hypothetical protein